jgi:hypothetical protein
MSVPVRDFLKRRRDRAVGSILGFAEREIFEDLSKEQREALRRTVLDALNGYHDSVLDLVKAEDGVRNDVVIELLERLDRNIEGLTRTSAREPVVRRPA